MKFQYLLAALAVPILGHFAWFQASSYRRTQADIAAVYENHRPLTMAEMDSYLVSGDRRQERWTDENNGKPLLAGLTVGMTMEEARATLPGGVQDKIYADMLRFPSPFRQHHQLAARFVNGKLLDVQSIPSSGDSFEWNTNSLPKRWGQPSGYDQ